ARGYATARRGILPGQESSSSDPGRESQCLARGVGSGFPGRLPVDSKKTASPASRLSEPARGGQPPMATKTSAPASANVDWALLAWRIFWGLAVLLLVYTL